MNTTRRILNLKEETISQEVRKEPKINKDREGSQFSAMMTVASELGFSISLPIAGGAILGQFLDGRLNTSPRLTLSLIFAGLFLGISNVYFIISRIQKGK